MAGRALVLGGGGVTGVAWEIGLIAGLADAGIELAAADLVVGTSAGSVVGAQLRSGASLEELYALQLEGPGAEIPASLGPGLLLRYTWIMLTSRDRQRAGVRFGRLALAADTMSEADRRAVMAARLPAEEWPAQRLLITAVDALSGEFRVFDRDSKASLLDAISASCAVPGVWPPVTVDGRRYIDGGMRSATNADLAAECDRIVVIAPISPRGRQVERLREHADVVVIRPDAASRAAAGRNLLDPARRGPSARAGRAQAASVAESVATVWG
jgi:NTE family protein